MRPVAKRVLRSLSWRRHVRSAALLLALAGAGPSARALGLESDLSTHLVDIRTNFQGAGIIVFGTVTGRSSFAPEPVDLIVVVRGPPRTVDVRRKERAGLIWANLESVAARGVPSFYAITSTRPLDQLTDAASLARFKIGFDHLAIELEAKPARSVVPPGNPPSEDRAGAAPPAVPEPMAVPATAAAAELAAFRQSLTRLMKSRLLFRDDAELAFVRADLFRTEITIPPTVPTGAYGAEVYLVQNRAIVGAEYMVFYIDKKGLEGDVSELAHKRPVRTGLLAVFIAVMAGWASELWFRRR